MHIIGIGASAGGLEALTSLVPQLQANGRSSYVIAQHMAHDGHSELMARLLNRGANLPVILAINNQTITADTIYLIPAGKDGKIDDNQIVLSDPKPEHFSTPSINVLFASIANNSRKNAIGIVLSGTGSDGVIGCRAIKLNGGFTIAQSPSSCVFDGMPMSAIEAKVIESVYSIDEMSGFLDKRFSTKHVTVNQLKEYGPNEFEPITDIIELINEVTKINFAEYKEETLLRRLEARIKKLGIRSSYDYLNHLKQHRNEVVCLQQLFLISYSFFFRDSPSFELLSTSLRKKMINKSVLNILVAGCASGEEVYTLAIVAHEIKNELRLNIDIKIVGIDLNSSAIDIARQGAYSSKAMKEIDPDIVKKYFSVNNDQFEIKDKIKALCSFINDDLFNYPLTEKLSLISCRNLLIYLKINAQEQLINKFHHSLESEGILFLGQAEALSPVTKRLFHQVNSAHNLYIMK